MARFELSLHPDYVPDWTITDGIREILQNALDQQIVNPRNAMTVDYYPDSECLRIGSKSSTLDKSSLLLGNTSKSNSSDLVGQFGEGYKLAMLVLTRAGKNFKIENFSKREIWEAKIINSRRYDSQLLCVDVEKTTFKTPPTSDLTFVVDGIDVDEWTEIVKSNLHLRESYPENLECSVGKILMSPAESGNIYVNGLFVSHTDAKFGYDFKPGSIKLDRDRKMIRDFELFWETSRMWLGKSDRPEFIEMLSDEDNIPDVQFCGDSVWGGHKATAIAYAKFVEIHGSNAYPVSSESEVANIKKLFPKAETVYVTPSYAKVIKNSKNFQDREQKLSDAPPPGVPEKLLRAHLRKFKKKMGIAERASFERLITSSIFWKDTRS